MAPKTEPELEKSDGLNIVRGTLAAAFIILAACVAVTVLYWLGRAIVHQGHTVQAAAAAAPAESIHDGIGRATLQDDGFGACPAFSHYHFTYEELKLQPNPGGQPDFDGKCHDDDTDKPIDERRKLPPPDNQEQKHLPSPDLAWS